MPRLLLVGIAGAAWPLLHRMIDAGRLPTIERLVEAGSSAALDSAGLTPAAFWATVATGVGPTVHGISTPLQVRADGGGVAPVGAAGWGAAPVWQVLAEAGLTVGVVGWPGLVPATAWPCLAVDERFAEATGSLAVDWPLPPGCIAPAELRSTLRWLRVHPGELEREEREGLPASALAAAATLQAAAVAAVQQPGWQMLAVFQPLLAAAPGEVAAGFVDAAMARLIGLAGEGTDVVLVSDAGVLVAAGPGFPVDAVWHGPAPADVAATVLARFGWLAEGNGRAWPAVEGLRPVVADRRFPPVVSLAGPPSTPEAVRLMAAIRRDGGVHAATAALADGDHAAAARLLEEVLTATPDDDDALSLLGQCRFFLGDLVGCRAIGTRLVQSRPESPWGAMMVGASFAMDGNAANAVPHLADAKRLAGQNAETHVRLGAISLHLGDPVEAATHYQDALAIQPDMADARAGIGLACLMRGDHAAGEQHILTSLGQRFHAPALHQQLGILYASQGRFGPAYACLRTALRQHPRLAGAAELLKRVEAALALKIRQKTPPS